MRKNKKIAAALLSIVLIGTILTGCGAKEQGVTSGDASTNSEEKLYKIGVCQYVEHDALDASYQGFLDGLKEAGYEEGKNLKIDFQNAQNDKSNCSTIASKLVNDKNDLILAIATPAAQTVVNETSEIPVLFTAVTDPVEAKLVDSLEAPGKNVTGTSDLTPIKEQIQLMTELLPEAKAVGMLYTSSEINSQIQVQMAVEAAEALGLTTVDASVSNSNEIQQVVQSLVGKVDVIYAPTDNMIANGMQTVALVTEPNQIPIFAAEEGMVMNGGLATYGINYYNLGKLTGEQAAKILGGESPANIPVGYLSNDDLQIVINKNSVDTLGIDIPEKYKEYIK